MQDPGLAGISDAIQFLLILGGLFVALFVGRYVLQAVLFLWATLRYISQDNPIIALILLAGFILLGFTYPSIIGPIAFVVVIVIAAYFAINDLFR